MALNELATGSKCEAAVMLLSSMHSVWLSEAESNKLKCLCLLFKPTCHRILTTQFILNGSMSRNKVVNFYVSFVDLKKLLLKILLVWFIPSSLLPYQCYWCPVCIWSIDKINDPWRWSIKWSKCKYSVWLWPLFFFFFLFWGGVIQFKGRN